MKLTQVMVLWLCAGAVMSNVALADDVLAAIEEAKSLYQQGNFSEAAQALDHASSLIRDQRANEVAEALPAAPAGWRADADIERTNLGAGIGGGMVSTKRTYYREGGDGQVSVAITTDSPAMQAVMMWIANPSMLGGSNGRAVRVQGQRGVQQYDTEGASGRIQLVVHNRYLVEVEGSGVTEAEVLQFANAVAMAKLTP